VQKRLRERVRKEILEEKKMKVEYRKIEYKEVGSCRVKMKKDHKKKNF